MQVFLTLWQRLNLEGIIRAQKSGDDNEFLTMFEVWNKVKVSDSTRKDYIFAPCPTCSSGRGFDMERVKLAPASEIELERAEARKLQSLLAGWKQFSVDDGEWLLPLKQILKEASGEESPAASHKSRESKRSMAG